MLFLLHPAQQVLRRQLQELAGNRHRFRRQLADFAGDFLRLDDGMSAATTSLTKPASRASTALIGRPITRSENAS